MQSLPATSDQPISSGCIMNNDDVITMTSAMTNSMTVSGMLLYWRTTSQHPSIFFTNRLIHYRFVILFATTNPVSVPCDDANELAFSSAAHGANTQSRTLPTITLEAGTAKLRAIRPEDLYLLRRSAFPALTSAEIILLKTFVVYSFIHKHSAIAPTTATGRAAFDSIPFNSAGAMALAEHVHTSVSAKNILPS